MRRLFRVVLASGRLRYLLLGLSDVFSWSLAFGLAGWVSHSVAPTTVDGGALVLLAAATAAVHSGLTLTRSFHPSRSRRGTSDDARSVLRVWLIAATGAALMNAALDPSALSMAILFLALPLSGSMMLAIRFGWRTWYERTRRPRASTSSRRVVVFGAGDGGHQIIRAMQGDPNSDYIAVAVLDDDKDSRPILGVPTLGTRHDIQSVASSLEAHILLIAVPSADQELIAELDLAGRAAGLEVRILPSTKELLGAIEVGDIRELTELDLLGREEVQVDMDAIRHYVSGRRVLVTGAGGSIGSELCRQIDRLEPAGLFMLDRDETTLHSLQLSIEGRALLDNPRLIVADVRDANRIDEIFEAGQFDVVFHTAALKHLTLLEQHPEEGLKTNVLGSANVLDAAVKHGVHHFVNVSTDKAADPTSMLGATKLLAERLTACAARQTGDPFVSVRFGNVLGSRGSVLPTFRKQIAAGGPVTITHPDVTRYFMTIPEAVRLVLQAGAIGRPGEIMILDMGAPVRIADLANRLIVQSKQVIEVVYTGLRTGEKLHEILVARSEIGATREHHRITHTIGSTETDVTPEVVLTAEAMHHISSYTSARTMENR